MGLPENMVPQNLLVDYDVPLSDSHTLGYTPFSDSAKSMKAMESQFFGVKFSKTIIYCSLPLGKFANPGRCSQTDGKPTRSCHIQWRVEKSMVNMTTTQQPSTVNVGLVGQIGNIATFDSKSLYSAVIIGNSNLVYLVDTWLIHGYKSGKIFMPSWSPKWLLLFFGGSDLLT